MNRLREIKNGDLYYNGYSLKALALKYGTPLKITFLDVIKEHVLSLKESFKKAIKETNYDGNFIYLNANKANYATLEIETSFLAGDGLETSSYYDLLLTRKFFEKHHETKKYIVSNGFKEHDYLDEIIDLHQNGYNIIDIIDSIDEYEYLKEKKVNLRVGMRIHLHALYHEEGDLVTNDRFGLNEEEINYILNDIKNTKLILTTIHYHQRGFDYEKDKFLINFNIALNHYLQASKHVDTLSILDIGGGTPLPIEEGFDYDKWSCDVLSLIKEFCDKNHLKTPNLMVENGKYSQKDSTVNVYKVVGKKNTNEIPWYVVNSSLLIAMPEMYALGEPILVMPVNGLDKPKTKGLLAGITCDCDDVLYDKKLGYFELPDVDELYIGIIGTGSYQNSMNGKGGVHHCLLPEEIDVVISEGKETIRHNLQTIDDICKLIKF